MAGRFLQTHKKRAYQILLLVLLCLGFTIASYPYDHDNEPSINLWTDSNPLTWARLAPEAQLWQNLSYNYVKSVRPVATCNETIQVYITVSLSYIGGMKWRDSMLHWDPEEFHGITELVVPARLIWLPEVSVIDSIVANEELSINNLFRVHIKYDGNVSWSPHVRMRTTCIFDLTYFPMDHQICSIKLTNWMYGLEAQNLSYYEGFSEPRLTDNFTTDGEWQLVRRWLWRKENSGHGLSYPIVGVSIVLIRNPRFYLMNIVAPFVILSMFSSLVFLIPPQTGEKISFGVNTMVSFSILFLFILEIMPSSGDYTPMLAIFAYVCMAQSTLCILLTSITLNMYHRKSSLPVPRCLNLFCSRFLAKIFSVHEEDSKPSYLSAARNSACWQARRRRTSNLELYKLTTHGLPGQFSRKDNDNIPSVAGLDIIKCRGLPNSLKCDKILNEQMNTDVVPSVSWKTASRLFDKMFFWISMITFCTYVVIFFFHLRNGRYE